LQGNPGLNVKRPFFICPIDFLLDDMCRHELCFSTTSVVNAGAGMANRVAGIGKAEMRVLDFVQRHGPVTVRAVADHFAATEGVGRTTVLNVLIRLWRKKHLTRRREGGGHIYMAREERLRLLRLLVGEFVGDVLGGNISPFVAYLAEEAGELTDEDRKQLAELLQQLQHKEHQ
jgi:predicted transcriptional regulator